MVNIKSKIWFKNKPNRKVTYSGYLNTICRFVDHLSGDVSNRTLFGIFLFISRNMIDGTDNLCLKVIIYNSGS